MMEKLCETEMKLNIMFTLELEQTELMKSSYFFQFKPFFLSKTKDISFKEKQNKFVKN